VARNRKRAKDRRARRPSPVGSSSVGPDRPEREDGAPDPIRHATPDIELAEAQMALGRPDLVEQPGQEPDEDFEVGDGDDGGSDDSGRGNGSGFGGDSPPPSSGGEVAAPAPAPTPAERPGLITRLIHFLQGSWRELQRVQWPDRRQVIQATGVVIGFVIVAGVYLGIADTVASHLMNYILTGKW
jgi:preprotein translocase SecE subunit